MAAEKMLYPAMTMEECAQRIADVVADQGFFQGQEADRYTVETSDGPVLVLVLEKYFTLQRASLVLTAVLDTVQDGALRVHLSSAGAYVMKRTERKVLKWVEEALLSG